MARKNSTPHPVNAEARLQQACLEMISVNGYALTIRAFSAAVMEAAKVIRAVDALDVADYQMYAKALRQPAPPKEVA